MKTGIATHFSTTSQTELIGKMTENENNKIPYYAREYKREYQFIRGINKEFKNLYYRYDDLNNGLFKSKRIDRLCKFIKRFLRAQESGKFKEFNIYEDDVKYLIKIKDRFHSYKLRYNAINNVDSDDFDKDCGEDNEEVYPGFGYVYNLFKIFFDKLNIVNDSDDDEDSDEYFDVYFDDF